MLHTHESALQRLAATLLEHEVVARDQIAALICETDGQLGTATTGQCAGAALAATP